jgi:hypothetical protein
MPISNIHCTTDLTLEILRQKEESGGRGGGGDAVKGATANIITGETDVFIALNL